MVRQTIGDEVDITIALPGTGDLPSSSLALSGTYKIKCYNQAGEFTFTDAINFGAASSTIRSSLESTCYWLRDNIVVYKGTADNLYSSDSLVIQIHFKMMTYGMSQFEIITTDGGVATLTGN